MRARHILYLAIVVAVAGAALAGCQLPGSVSISQRIGYFQDALNTADRSTAFENFYPGKTNDYDSIKSGTFSWSVIADINGIPYSLSITDQSDPSAVLVTLTGNAVPPLYLRLNMQTTGNSDYRIVSIDTRPNLSSGWTVGVIN